MQTVGTGQSNTAITLDQLIALNDEMAALIRAGVPLEQGLKALGGDLPGRSGKLAEMLADRMNAGESLSQILSDQEQRFPPVWRAVVEAGLRSGHLAAAMESLSATSRRIADLRKIVAAGIVYPAIVVTLAYLLLLFLLTWLVPVALQANLELAGSLDPLLAALQWLGRTARWWAIPLPLAVALVCGAWWRRSGQALWTKGGARVSRPSRRFRGIGFRNALWMGRMATFSEVMALLVREQVPLGDAVVLAAEASGDPAIISAARQIADSLRRGDVFLKYDDLPPALPPLLGWLLSAGGRPDDLTDALSRSAAVYRTRASRAARAAAVYLPISLTVFVGGTATLLCALVTFLPIVRLYYHLALP